MLICTADLLLMKLLAQNLTRRNFGVVETTWTPCCGAGSLPQCGAPFDLVVADIDCADAIAWRGATELRVWAPVLPIILLGYNWPDIRRLHKLRPAGHIHKPFGIDELIRVVTHFLPDDPALPRVA